MAKSFSTMKIDQKIYMFDFAHAVLLLLCVS